jgi:hypothetical protein
MNFKQLADETFAEAWESYYDFMTNLPTVGRLGIHPVILLRVATRS